MTITKKIAEARGWKFDTLYPGDLIVARLINMDSKCKLRTEKWVVGFSIKEILQQIEKEIQDSPAL